MANQTQIVDSQGYLPKSSLSPVKQPQHLQIKSINTARKQKAQNSFGFLASQGTGEWEHPLIKLSQKSTLPASSYNTQGTNSSDLDLLKGSHGYPDLLQILVPLEKSNSSPKSQTQVTSTVAQIQKSSSFSLYQQEQPTSNHNPKLKQGESILCQSNFAGTNRENRLRGRMMLQLSHTIQPVWGHQLEQSPESRILRAAGNGISITEDSQTIKIDRSKQLNASIDNHTNLLDQDDRTCKSNSTRNISMSKSSVSRKLVKYLQHLPCTSSHQNHKRAVKSLKKIITNRENKIGSIGMIPNDLSSQKSMKHPPIPKDQHSLSPFSPKVQDKNCMPYSIIDYQNYYQLTQILKKDIKENNISQENSFKNQQSLRTPGREGLSLSPFLMREQTLNSPRASQEKDLTIIDSALSKNIKISSNSKKELNLRTKTRSLQHFSQLLSCEIPISFEKAVNLSKMKFLKEETQSLINKTSEVSIQIQRKESDSSLSILRSRATIDNLLYRINSQSKSLNLSPEKRNYTPSFKQREEKNIQQKIKGLIHKTTECLQEKSNSIEGQSSFQIKLSQKEMGEERIQNSSDTFKNPQKRQHEENISGNALSQAKLTKDKKIRKYSEGDTLFAQKESPRRQTSPRKYLRDRTIEIQESVRKDSEDNLDDQKFLQRKRSDMIRQSSSKEKEITQQKKQLGTEEKLILASLARLLETLKQLAKLPKIYQKKVFISLNDLWWKFGDFRSNFLDQEKCCVKIAASLKVENIFDSLTRDKLLKVYGFDQNSDSNKKLPSKELLLNEYLRKDLNVFVQITDEFLIKLQSQQLYRIQEQILSSHSSIVQLENKMKFNTQLLSQTSLQLKHEYRTKVKPSIETLGPTFNSDEGKFQRKEHELGYFTHIQLNSKLMGRIINGVFENIKESKLINKD